LLELSTSPEECSRLGNAGREFVSDRFSVDHMVDELHELYLTLLNP